MTSEMSVVPFVVQSVTQRNVWLSCEPAVSIITYG